MMMTMTTIDEESAGAPDGNAAPSTSRKEFNSSAVALMYKIVGALLLALYAALGFAGWEPGSDDGEEFSPSVKNSPGGYKSMSLWHVGIHGGK